MCLLLVGTAFADTPSLLVLGDSLSAGYGIPVTHGWVSLLQRRLDEQGYPQRVVNASISGETTRGARERIEKLLSEHQPQIVIIELGGNDGLRGLSLAEMRRNLVALTSRARSASAQVLLIEMRLPPNYGHEYTRLFEHVFHEVAADTGATLTPFILDDIADQTDLMQADGIHPRVEAQPAMLENIWPKIEALLVAVQPYE